MKRIGQRDDGSIVASAFGRDADPAIAYLQAFQLLGCWQTKCSCVGAEVMEGDSPMLNDPQTKCAHIPCQCEVKNGDKYCGESCRDAGNEEVEIACNCDHMMCPLTA